MRLVSGQSALPLARSAAAIGIFLTLARMAMLSISAVEAQRPPVSISKSASPDPSVLGGELTYILTVTNTGTVALTGVVISDETPRHTTFLGASGPDLWRMTSPAYGEKGTVTWLAPAPLEPGQTVQLRFLVRVEAPGLEPIVNSRYEVRADGLTMPVTGEPVTTTVILPTPTFTPPPGPTAKLTPTREEAKPTPSAPLPQPTESPTAQAGSQNLGKVVIVLMVMGLGLVFASAWMIRKRTRGTL